MINELNTHGQVEIVNSRFIYFYINFPSKLSRIPQFFSNDNSSNNSEILLSVTANFPRYFHRKPTEFVDVLLATDTKELSENVEQNEM